MRRVPVGSIPTFNSTSRFRVLAYLLSSRNCAAALILFLSFVLYTPGIAQQQPSEQELVDALMEASGFNSSLLDIWLGMEASIADEPGLVEHDEHIVQQLIKSGFYGQRLIEAYAGRLTEQLNPTYALSVTAFLNSESGKHILEHERREQNATDDELEDFATGFDPEHGDNHRRIELISKIMVETRARENTTEILHALYKTLLLASNAAGNEPTQRMSESEFGETSEIIRQQLERQMGPYILMSMMYTYRDVEMRHLQNYVNHLSGTSGTWYTGTLHEILLQVLGQAHQQVVNEIELMDS